MPQAKTEVALQFLECCAAETALQHSLFCSADAICTKSCTAANEKLHCNVEIAALQESGAFLPLSCGFQAPTFRHPRLGLAEKNLIHLARGSTRYSWGRTLQVLLERQLCVNRKVIFEFRSSLASLRANGFIETVSSMIWRASPQC